MVSFVSPKLPTGFFARPIAHRALHDAQDGRPENSLMAVRAAIAGGYAIEVDLQLSRDGEAMMFHDAALGRLTKQKGAVRDHDADELQQILLRNGDETIPTFSDLLDEVAGKTPLLIEIKDQSAELGPTDGRLARRVAELLADYPGDAAVMSFNPRAIAHFARANSGVPFGLVTCDFSPKDWPGIAPTRLTELARLKAVEQLGCAFVSHDVDDLDNPTLAKFRARNMPIFCWTVKSQSQADSIIGKTDNITFEGFTPLWPLPAI